MWVTAVDIVTLMAILAALGYVARSTRKLDVRLDTLVAAESERRRRMEQERDRVRQSVAAITAAPGC